MKIVNKLLCLTILYSSMISYTTETTNDQKQLNQNINLQTQNNKHSSIEQNIIQQTENHNLLKQYNDNLRQLEDHFIKTITKDVQNNDKYKEGLELISQSKFYKAKLFFEKLYDETLLYYEMKKNHLLLIYLDYKLNRSSINEMIKSYKQIFPYNNKDDTYTAFIIFLEFHLQFAKKKDIRYDCSDINQIIELGNECTFQLINHKKICKTTNIGIKLLKEFLIYRDLYIAQLFKQQKQFTSSILIYKNIMNQYLANKELPETSLEAVYRLIEIFKELELDTRYFIKILKTSKDKKWYNIYLNNIASNKTYIT
ncbi:MAG: hypothetical protein AAFO15_00395 [Pseudomonadota bacterium]